MNRIEAIKDLEQKIAEIEAGPEADLPNLKAGLDNYNHMTDENWINAASQYAI